MKMNWNLFSAKITQNPVTPPTPTPRISASAVTRAPCIKKKKNFNNFLIFFFYFNNNNKKGAKNATFTERSGTSAR